MGRRTLESEGRKLNLFKVFIAIIALVIIISLIYFSIKGIIGLFASEDNEISKDNVDLISQNEVIEEKNKTIEEILNEFGGEVKTQIKEDTYFVSKDGVDYTVYLDGEITEGIIIPWDGKDAKPAIDEAGNINVYSAAELAWIANQVILGEKNFSGVTITLRKNIDLGAREKEDGSWEGPEWKAIIGFLDEMPNKSNTNTESNTETKALDDTTMDVTNENLKRFDGVFNANGCSIRGMKIESNKRYQGLFGYVSGTVSNLTIKHSYINGKDGVGAIAGLSSGRIINCIVEDTNIIGEKKIGGIVGVAMTEALIENCSTYENCNVEGNENIGGLIGYTNNNVSIKNSTNGATVEGENYVGGITGISFYGTSIQNCLNYSSQIEGEQYVGGLVGYSAAQIEKSSNQITTSNTGKVVGKNYVGGIVGLNYEMGDINECFNNGEVIVLEDNCGGIVGLNGSNVSNCYNKGKIDCTQASGLKIGGVCGQNISESFINNSYNIGKINNTNYAGGLIGADFGTITNSYCLETSLNKQTTDIEYNKTSEELKNIILQELGESFKVDSENINSGFPILKWQ